METQALQIVHRMEIVRRGRFWAVHDGAGLLVCVAVYKKGAAEVVRRLAPGPAVEETAEETPNGVGSECARKETRHGTRHAPYDLHR